MARWYRPVVTLVLILSLLANTLAYAGNPDPLGMNKDLMSVSGGSEFVFRNDPEEMLVPVFVLGAVAKPGIYHIPVKTDLVTLLTLAGGPIKEAITDDIVIKKQQTKEVVNVDLDKLISMKDLKAPSLNNNDVVFLKTKEPAVSQDTLAIIGLVASVLGVGIAALALSKSK